MSMTPNVEALLKSIGAYNVAGYAPGVNEPLQVLHDAWCQRTIANDMQPDVAEFVDSTTTHFVLKGDAVFMLWLASVLPEEFALRPMQIMYGKDPVGIFNFYGDLTAYEPGEAEEDDTPEHDPTHKKPESDDSDGADFEADKDDSPSDDDADDPDSDGTEYVTLSLEDAFTEYVDSIQNEVTELGLYGLVAILVAFSQDGEGRELDLNLEPYLPTCADDGHLDFDESVSTDFLDFIEPHMMEYGYTQRKGEHTFVYTA